MCRVVAGKSAETRAKDFGKCPLISDHLKFLSKHYFHVFWPTNREIVTRFFFSWIQRQVWIQRISIEEIKYCNITQMIFPEMSLINISLFLGFNVLQSSFSLGISSNGKKLKEYLMLPSQICLAFLFPCWICPTRQLCFSFLPFPIARKFNRHTTVCVHLILLCICISESRRKEKYNLFLHTHRKKPRSGA